MNDAKTPARPAMDEREAEAAALAAFTEYLVKNYPGPHTIISDPNWHAPRIFRAAKHALALLRRDAPREGASEADIERRLDALVEEYEWRGDDGDYTPNERETMLLFDFAHGLLADDELVALLRSRYAAPDRAPREGGEAPCGVLADFEDVERVAAAIWENRQVQLGNEAWDEAHPDDQSDYRAIARAAISAMSPATLRAALYAAPPTAAPSDAVGALPAKWRADADFIEARCVMTPEVRAELAANRARADELAAALASRPVVDGAMAGRLLDYLPCGRSRYTLGQATKALTAALSRTETKEDGRG